MDVLLRVKRYNPETDEKPYWAEYELHDVEPVERVLDLLHHVKWHVDGTLSFRRSCAHGVCGSDAMRINDLVLTDIRENGWAPRISDTIEETKAAVEGTYRRLLRGIGEIRNVNSTLFVDEEVERLYYQIDRPFNQWLSELRAGDSMDDRIFAWRGILKRIILQQAERLIENAGPRDYTGIVADNKVKNIATVYNSFIYFLNQQIKLKEESHGEDTAG